MTSRRMRDIIIKMSHESESQGNERAKGRSEKRNGSSAVKLLKKCSRKVHLTRKRKCDRIERLTVLGSLFGERKK